MRSDELEELAQGSVGTTLAGKWRLEALVGVGGMAAVYRARHANNGRVVAIKVLHETFRRESSIRQRFVREAKIANHVNHPAVVRFFDDGLTDDGRPFLVTDLLSGSDLEDVRAAAGGTLPLASVVEIGSLLLSVLEVAHAAGVIHRDLKPANLFRKDDGTIMVLDFGLARAFEDSDEGGTAGSALTSVDSLLGTVGYMAPEQAQGRWDLVGPATDLFAVGATLLKLATGLPVHEAEGTHARLMLAATKPVPKTSPRAPALPPAFAEVLDRALEFSQRDRFEDAKTFRLALEASESPAIEPAPVAPAPAAVSGVEKPVERAERPRASVLPWLAALALAFGGIGVGAYLWFRVSASEDPVETVVATPVPAPPSASSAPIRTLLPTDLPPAPDPKARGNGSPKSPAHAPPSRPSAHPVASTDDPMDRRR